MAYIPTEWETGDVITAEKLNKAEEGIQLANTDVLIVTASEGTLDKKFSEIYSAFPKVLYAYDDEGEILYSPVAHFFIVDDSEYEVKFGNERYKATTADGYPVLDLG